MSRVGVLNFTKGARTIADRATLAIGAATMLLPGMAWAQDATTAAPAAAPAAAAAAPKFDSGDTAWMLTSTALVLMMTVPGLALFYGGMVRKMNVLATVMQSFAVTCFDHNAPTGSSAQSLNRGITCVANSSSESSTLRFSISSDVTASIN